MDKDMKVEIITTFEDMMKHCQKGEGARRIFDACYDVYSYHEDIEMEPRPDYIPLAFGKPVKPCLEFDLHWKDTEENRMDLRSFAQALQYGSVTINGEPVIEPKMVWEEQAGIFRPSNREMEETRKELEGIIEKAKLPFSVDFTDELPFVESKGHQFMISQPTNLDIEEVTPMNLRRSCLFLPVKAFNMERIAQEVTNDFFRKESIDRANEYIENQLRTSGDVVYEPVYRAFDDMQKNVGELAFALQDYVHTKYQERFAETLGKGAQERHAERVLEGITQGCQEVGINETKMKKLVSASLRKAYPEKQAQR